MDLDSSHWVQSLFRRMDLPKGILQTLTRSPTRKHTNISRLFQRCFSIDKRGATLNQRWNNVIYVNVGIYNAKQRRINIFYFNVFMNNLRQRRNKFDIFNINFHNVGQGPNNAANMTISKKNKRNKLKNTYKAIRILKTWWKIMHYKDFIWTALLYKHALVSNFTIGLEVRYDFGSHWDLHVLSYWKTVLLTVSFLSSRNQHESFTLKHQTHNINFYKGGVLQYMIWSWRP